MKNIKLEELTIALPLGAANRKSYLRKCQSIHELKEVMLKDWFQDVWLDTIHRKLCAEDTTVYKAGFQKQEKIDIIFSYLYITDLIYDVKMPVESEEAPNRITAKKKFKERANDEFLMMAVDLGKTDEEFETLDVAPKWDVENYHTAKSTPTPLDWTYVPTPASSPIPEAPPQSPLENQEIDETLSINEENQELDETLTLKKVRQFISTYPEKLFHGKDRDIEDFEVEIMEGMPITYQSEFLLDTDLSISLNLVVLLDLKSSQVLGFGHLERDKDHNNRYHIVMEKENIDFSAFKKPYKYRVGLFSEEVYVSSQGIGTAGDMYTKVYPVEFKSIETTKNTLCIDFGTSNTCAGTYGLLDTKKNEVEIVKFETEQSLSDIYPTILYVDDCSDPNNISYSFGYEALKKVKSKKYDTNASVFFELKRFMSTLEEEEEICDEEGYTETVTRAQLVEAYLLHIIALSEQYFKVKFENLHFSAPVKMKSLFFSGLQTMLTKHGYSIAPPEQSVDEGIAIVYYNIKNIIQYNEDLNDGQKDDIKIMILDCGGGTTDLASCAVEYEKMDTSEELIINSSFVGGNSNFGGNNITYKILQLIKIKLVEKLKNSREIDLLSVIKHDENEILDKSDKLLGENTHSFHVGLESFRKSIYGDFQTHYDDCEKVIPTQFEKRKGNPVSRADLAKKKRNYYYLWQLAEKIKIEFYETDIVSYNISDESTENSKMNTSKEEFYIYNQEDKLELQSIGQVSITVKELHRLLCGDIYCLLNSLLLKEEGNLHQYTHYKLAGQSCKISLFMELLKEFIPGRRLRLSTTATNQQSDNSGSLRLKRGCIEGAILYRKDVEYSNIRPEIRLAPPPLIYDVLVDKMGKKKLLGQGNPPTVDFEYFNYDTSKVEFLIENASKEIENTFTVELCHEEILWESMDLDEIFDKIHRESHMDPEAKEDLTNAIHDINPEDSGKDESVLLGLPVLSQEGYGVNIYFIEKTRRNGVDSYKIYQTIYKNFEDETTKTFFDGSK